MQSFETDLLIVGAGSFCLAIAAQAAHLGIDHLVAGKPMGFLSHHLQVDDFAVLFL